MALEPVQRIMAVFAKYAKYFEDARVKDYMNRVSAAFERSSSISVYSVCSRTIWSSYIKLIRSVRSS